ncbi:ribonucleoside-diphosphate reductase, adenosylcobalamin-dependent [Pseudofrankia sp. EUN1h]|nr:ribonucleoside-diphosphate reductase, adenosylcobalamin-dependent [Pseudofrankia sp. EUN1h]
MVEPATDEFPGVDGLDGLDGLPRQARRTPRNPQETEPRTGRGIQVSRRHTTPDAHPYDEVTWEQRDVVLTGRDGTAYFVERGVEFPDFWSTHASDIATSRYFRGVPGTPGRERSLRQLVDRVVGAHTAAGRSAGYFASDEDALAFEHELTWLLVHQVFSFNSPVWFNVGTPAPQQVASCFILSVDDSLESIMDWYRAETLLFRGGAGVGVNVSRLRSSRELLSSGRPAAGPVSFVRGADATAGAIRTGNATRPAAKMVVLDVDHPDIVDFVECKAREETKIRVLRDAGFDLGVGGRDLGSVQFQNANNSVRVSDAFMRAVLDDAPFALRARRDGRTVETVRARELFRAIARAAWECADPGLHYADTIDGWHTCPQSGPISASNSCSEYMHLDDSAATLASLNLMRFLRADGGFDVDGFVAAVELVLLALDIAVGFGELPTPRITQVTRDHRQVGVGYANLGALLMAMGYAYDSTEGRATAAAVTSLMTAVAYRRSAQLAAALGAYEGFARNAAAHRHVVGRHAEASAQACPAGPADAAILDVAAAEWERARALGARHGWRNAHVSLIAPTGTIGLVMDCDTMGIEPDLALVKTKNSATGSVMRLVNRTVARALRALGHGETAVAAIVAHVAEHGHVAGAPGLAPEHLTVFDCAVGARSIAPLGHVRMMAAVQPFLSGAISKTVNLPASATVDDVERIYLEGWRLGLKALAVYRDGCKVGQPLSASTSTTG